MPSAKLTSPAAPEPRPSSSTSQTKAKRCVACTKPKPKVLIQRYVKGRDLNAEKVSSVGRPGAVRAGALAISVDWVTGRCCTPATR